MTDRHKDLKLLYQQLVELVTVAVNEWDPLDLLGAGAPDTEYADEIIKVVAKLPKATTTKALAQVISAVFSEAFGPPVLSVEECEPVASRIRTDLTHRRLLQ